MNNKKRFNSFLLSIIFTLSLVFNSLFGINSDIKVNAETANIQNVVNTIDEGAILHAWNWSFNTIKEKLPEIKAAGYKAVQTSPIQGNKEDLMSNSKWWILYQPINFKIGNAQLGTRDEFKSMCDAAEAQGIKVIVDVIANHTGNRGDGADKHYPANNVDPAIKNNPDYWHESRGIDNWNDRWQVTHLGIGLPDLNTSNHGLQDMIINFLNDAIACGADGFRVDTAKHIELPNDPGGSDFWPRVLGALNNKENLFIYGEVLQGGADNINEYHKYIKTTCDSYGNIIRSSVGYNGNINLNSAKSYTVSGSPTNLITWVESHDTYANEKKETVGLTNEQIKLAWAMISGRNASTPLFFNRPSGGYLAGNMGSAGDNMWKDPVVVAANKFRNKMAGENEYVRTQGNDLFIIERGTKGAMIVNVANYDVNVNVETALPVGEYKDTFSGKTFNVINKSGKNYFSGSISSKTIATLESVVEINNPEVASSVASNTKFVDSLNVTLSSKNTVTSTYSINGSAAKNYVNGEVIKLGTDSSVGAKITLTLNGVSNDGKTTTATYIYEKAEQVEEAISRIKVPSGWGTPNIYVYDASVNPVKEIAKWPGVAMTNEGNGVYSYKIPKGFGTKTQVIFNSGSNQIPEANQPGFYISDGESQIYENGEWKNYVQVTLDPEVSSSVKSGTTFTGSLKLTLYSKNTVSSTYSIDGKTPTFYKDGQEIAIGADSSVGSKITLTLTAEGQNRKTTTATYVYEKVAPVIETIARIKVPSGWGTPNIYVYDASVNPVKEIAKWPGVAMTNEGNGVYSYKIPKGFGTKTQVIFNSGSNQVPGANQPGFYIYDGESKIYENGEWKNYVQTLLNLEVSRLFNLDNKIVS
ncbi:starch-binding protein [Clostridium sp. DSM 100503]|uniref:starch-binding protein n=1 Tax=Clostridium sp. DSM 100503 TaxID=2963282 RepID=UPI00214A16C0|nr:starch-binding protein [Clostridium sp. DSM 100503]MCR1951214.1 starch-binding protein [Clostridium sp. DSM 100503]